MNKKEYKLRELADYLSADLKGDADQVIVGICALDNGKPNYLSFLNKSSYSKHVGSTKASAIILTPEFYNENLSGNFLLVKDPYLSQAKLSKLFDDAPMIDFGIHKTAVIGEECEIADNVSIGPNCVIGRKVKIDSGVKIEAGSVIADEVVIGSETKICANVTIYHKVEIGKRVCVHSGTVIGSDGFGNANENGVWHKIYQLGTVIVGDDVEIGSNTTIDRGAIDNTVIGNGVKIDNQVQIAHNVHIGDHTAIAGCTGIAGSTKIGRHCMIAGRVGISGHIEIADRVVITGMSSVAKSIKEPGGVYASGIPAIPHRSWWRVLSRLMSLEKLSDRIKNLEKK